MTDFLMAFVAMLLTVGVLGGWAVRANRRRRQADEPPRRHKEEVV